MAYQPKFARKNHQVSPFFVLLGVIVVPISLALTAVLLGKMAQFLSRPKAAAQTAPADMTIMEQFDGFVSTKMDAARDTLTAAQTPENVPETTVPVREKVIIEIPDDAQVAPTATVRPTIRLPCNGFWTKRPFFWTGRSCISVPTWSCLRAVLSTIIWTTPYSLSHGKRFTTAPYTPSPR